MKTNKYLLLGVVLSIALSSCKTIDSKGVEKGTNIPNNYTTPGDTSNTATIQWKKYFNDLYLVSLIDTALANNQEFNIMLQEIEMSKNEINARKGEYLPFVNIGVHADADKEGRFTRHGALDKQLNIEPGVEMPEPYTNIGFGAYASWEVDIWKKLRNAKKAATLNYLSNIEGRRYMQTNLVAEIASLYYELLSLDNKLNIIDQNIEIQSNALQSVILKKQASQVTELAVKKFEAQLLNSKSFRNEVLQEIISTENKLNFLVGRTPQKIERKGIDFMNLGNAKISIGTPAQLVENRPDVKAAELKLMEAKVNIDVARASFYPSLRLMSGLGMEAYKLKLLSNPESMLFNAAGELISPLINRKALKANFSNANAKQKQALLEYQRTLLNAYLEVETQQAKFENFKTSVAFKEAEVNLLNQSVSIANDLFYSARADYMEVLMTQRDFVESKVDLVESKLKQLEASVMLYKALGGGWR